MASCDSCCTSSCRTLASIAVGALERRVASSRNLLAAGMQVCDCDCLPVRPIEGDLPAFSAAIFRRDDVHKELVRQKSRKLEQVAAVLQRADSPTSPLPAEYPGKPGYAHCSVSTFQSHVCHRQALGSNR